MTREQLEWLLTAGVKHGASDIHFRCGSPPTFRVRGMLAALKHDKLTPADTLAICEHIIKNADVRAKLSELQEYDTSYSQPGVARYRVNIHRQRGSLSLVLRIIPSTVPTLEELVLPDVVRSLAESQRGLLLVTGATGVGKTSTLSAIINHINHSQRVHILTIEDPIEFLHRNDVASVTQREVGIDTRSFNVALRSALRQDPDVLMVGEMRDQESVEIALKAAETGHLVLSTVHTTDAAKTIGRLLSFFSPDEQPVARHRLADNLRATISQRLLPRADGKGRIVACEIMVQTGTVQDWIRDPAKTSNLMSVLENGRSQYGMQSFDQHLIDLYRAGTITLETARLASTNPGDLTRALEFE